MFDIEALIVKTISVNACAARSVSVHKVTGLYHESLDYSVEWSAFISDRFWPPSGFTGAKLPEILSCQRHLVSKQLHLQSTLSMSSYWNVKKNYRICVFLIWHFIFIKKSPAGGLEPPTTSLKGWRSTDWARRAF